MPTIPLMACRRANFAGGRMAGLYLPGALAVAALVGPSGGCKDAIECRAVLSQGGKTFEATVQQRDERATVEDAAVRKACERLCRDSPPPDADAEWQNTCLARCQGDVDAKRVSLRLNCDE